MITSDDIERNGFAWCMVDELRSKAPRELTPIIMNTDRSDSLGLHWIALMKLKNKRLYMYDPLGAENRRVDHTGAPIDQLIATELKIQPERIHMYRPQTQRATTSLCGWYSLYAASLMYNLARDHKLDDSDAPHIIDEYLSKSFDRRPTQHNERILRHFFK